MNKSIKIFHLFFIAIFALTACNDDDDTTQAMPLNASYTYVIESPTSGIVSFINTSDHADRFTWDFGDGTSASVKNPSKTFDATGDYTVTLTATNSDTNESDTFSSVVSVFVFDDGLATNGDFEGGTTAWTTGVDVPLASDLIVTEDGNSYYSVNVTAAGEPFSVNLSQTGLDLTEGTTYTLTFDAWSDVERSILAGIGLSGPPWTNVTEAINLTTSPQNFSRDFVANFSSSNSRIIFDMGAEVGMVNIDNVTLTPVP